MTGFWVCMAVAAGCGMSIALALGFGRAVHLADQAQADTDPEPEWSQQAVDEAFALLIPDLVTADSFELDAKLNRRAGWSV